MTAFPAPAPEGRGRPSASAAGRRRRSGARAADATPSLFAEEAREARAAAVAGAGDAPEPECVEVALDRPIDGELSYALAPGQEGVRVGARVVVPLGRRREVGVVVRRGGAGGVAPGRLRAVERVLDEAPLLGEELLRLARWVANRYACSWGEALAAMLPRSLKREAGGRRVLAIRAAGGAGPADLEALAARHEKQHRLLRALLDLGGPIELREIGRRLRLSDAPARSLVRKGLAVLESAEAGVELGGGAIEADRRPAELSEGQRAALAAIEASLEAPPGAGGGRTFLLQGVTGSGKTEVYLRAIERSLALGRGAIVVVPEIALTPQTVGRFRARLGEVGVLHSRMTDAQRKETWLRVQRGELRVVVGARSALFAPVAPLGVVVVDEEHEPSFKQANVPRYHARDVAMARALDAGATCVLGSATPSLESWELARSGRIERLLLPDRVAGGRLPEVRVVDLRAEPRTKGVDALFSRPLARALRDALARGEQAILFLNRRGFAPVLWCTECAETVRCAECSLSLAWHRRIRRLVCHACCAERAMPDACPVCTAPALRAVGSGSERVEAALAELAPEARVRRMDSDTMVRRQDYEELLGAFGRGEIDVLVGTQMVAKGLDFPRVTVVGVIDADLALHLPDFRAAERTHQLIAQVTGRAGRGSLPGVTVVQTSSPEHPAIRLAASGAFDAFAEREIRLRAELGYPPAGRLVRIVFEDRDLQRAREASERCGRALREAIAPAEGTVLGPSPAPIDRLRGRHRVHLLVKGTGERALSAARASAAAYLRSHRPRASIDVDPVSML